MTFKEKVRAEYLLAKSFLIKRRNSTNGVKPSLQLSRKDRVVLEYEHGERLRKTKLTKHPILYFDPFGFLHSYKEIFEDNVYFFESEKPAPIIIDCGSNIGLSILYFKKLFPSSKIIGYEPDPGLFKVLETNIATFHFKDIELRQQAVWIQDETLAFEMDASLAGRLSDGTENANTVSVQAIRLKDVLSKLPGIDFLKLDIEFAELKVIEDLGETLLKVENIFLEFHNTGGHYGQDLMRILQALEAAGFAYYIKEAFNFLDHPFTQKARLEIKSTGNYLNIFGVRPK